MAPGPKARLVHFPHGWQDAVIGPLTSAPSSVLEKEQDPSYATLDQNFLQGRSCVVVFLGVLLSA